ncbi:MAG: DHA2 family efflux MFS transporter permease subunit [Proteobacteria bacterium]|nr:DHA2 family efflux MFS transporter permease subunit [Pseudomonadota bacterium]
MDRRWLAFIVLCLGDLMIVLDSTVVNVALPSIRDALGFSEASLAWVVNAYLLTFGGFLLLGGRLADLYGQRRLFLIGLCVFTAASLACGLANSAVMLVAARAVQGLGGAVVSAVALSLITNLFPEQDVRVRAMGYFGFVMAAGGSVGVLLGGLLTDAFDWHWIFLINLPVGAAVFVAAARLLPVDVVTAAGAKLDVGGAITITTALLLAIYAIVGGNAAGWTSIPTLSMLGASAALFAAFLAIEAKATAPLMPLRLFRFRNVSVSNIIGVLWAAGMFAWFFLSALYMQSVLGYSPMQVGLAFLPANIIMGAFSYKLSAIVVNRFGIRRPLAVGLIIAAAGLMLFAMAPAEGTFVMHVLPGMALLGIGAGVAFNPILLAAMNDVKPEESGLASGVVNTSFMMGGALGLAVLASLAAARAVALIGEGATAAVALHGGYQVAFALGAALALMGGLLAFTLHDSKPAEIKGY